MRPVNKLNPGNYTATDGSVIEIEKSYTNYREAKPALIYNLGAFCSYCEDSFGSLSSKDTTKCARH